jgi:hypothetical protein
MAEDRARKDAKKRAEADWDAKQDREAVSYARVLAARRAQGGAGDPFRDADSHIIASRGAAAAAAASRGGGGGMGGGAPPFAAPGAPLAAPPPPSPPRA